MHRIPGKQHKVSQLNTKAMTNQGIPGGSFAVALARVMRTISIAMTLSAKQNATNLVCSYLFSPGAAGNREPEEKGFSWGKDCTKRFAGGTAGVVVLSRQH